MKVDALERSVPLENAEKLFLQAKYDECLAALTEDNSPQARVLRARTLLRLGRHADLLRSGFYFDAGDLPQEYRARGLVALSAALFRSDMPEQAKGTLQAAKRAAHSSGNALAIAEATYHEALQHWSDGFHSEASRHLDADIEWDSFEVQRRELRAAIAASTGHYQEQIALLRSALDILSQQRAYDVFVAAWCTHTLASMAREMYNSELARFVERWVQRIPWTPDIAVSHCQSLRYVAWFYATAGNGPVAYEYFARSADVAPNGAFKALSLVDRAYMANGMGECASSKYFVTKADDIMSRIDWDTITGDERFVLLLASELAAGQSPAHATFYLSKFEEIRTQLSKLSAYGRPDPRPAALLSYTRGVAKRAAEEGRVAADLILDAFRTWKSLGYTWRAVLAAIHLGELQHNDAYLDYARITMEKEFPHIWFRRLLAPHSGRLTDNRLLALSKSERQLFVMTLKGQNRAEIAAHLRVSEHTIRNRMTSMLRKLSVKDTRDLLVKFSDITAH